MAPLLSQKQINLKYLSRSDDCTEIKLSLNKTPVRKKPELYCTLLTCENKWNISVVPSKVLSIQICVAFQKDECHIDKKKSDFRCPNCHICSGCFGPHPFCKCPRNESPQSWIFICLFYLLFCLLLLDLCNFSLVFVSQCLLNAHLPWPN